MARVNRTCQCGCGGQPKGAKSRFLPGHDARVHVQAILNEMKRERTEVGIRLHQIENLKEAWLDDDDRKYGDGNRYEVYLDGELIGTVEKSSYVSGYTRGSGRLINAYSRVTRWDPKPVKSNALTFQQRRYIDSRKEAIEMLVKATRSAKEQAR